MDEKNRILKEQQMRASINAKLIETGERERYLFFFKFKDLCVKYVFSPNE